MKTLLVGFGNPMRSDDGVGAYVVDSISKLGLPNVDARICHQLGIELIDEVRAYDQIIFVDAGDGRPAFRFRRLNGEAPSTSTTHSLSPETLYRLARKLFPSVPDFYLCTVGAADFAFGEGFSDDAIHSARGAVDFLKEILGRKTRHARSQLHREHRSSHFGRAA